MFWFVAESSWSVVWRWWGGGDDGEKEEQSQGSVSINDNIVFQWWNLVAVTATVEVGV